MLRAPRTVWDGVMSRWPLGYLAWSGLDADFRLESRHSDALGVVSGSLAVQFDGGKEREAG